MHSDTMIQKLIDLCEKLLDYLEPCERCEREANGAYALGCEAEELLSLARQFLWKPVENKL